jgi:Holliday junction DNA helicase RuvA
MISRLRGTLTEKAENRVVVDVNGVGYGLNVPATVFFKLPQTEREVTLQVYTNVREDAITLFGFLTHLERDVFEILMTANGVGPKLALTILSALEANQILEAIALGNRDQLTGITGVGKKTAERLFIELKEKCEKRLMLERGGISALAKGKKSEVGTAAAWASDLESALFSLGYRENDIRQIAREVVAREEAKDLESGLKIALKLFAGSPKTMRGNV